MQVPVIAHCTGERGLINHLLSFKFGGAFAYGCIEGHAVPGLPSINNLRHPYAVKNLDKNTIVFGLISKPVNHSKGPLLHNPAFRQIGFNGVYVPMLVDDLTEFFSVYSRRDFAGFRYIMNMITSSLIFEELCNPLETCCFLHLFTRKLAVVD